MKHIKPFAQFLNEAITSSELVLQKHAIRMQKKYLIHEIGLIRAWGSRIYLSYYNLSKSGTMVPYKEYVKILSEYAVLDEYSEEFEDLDDWMTNVPPTINKVPLWNQDRLQDDFNKMANKTPTDREITLYRTSKKEEPGLNSYTVSSSGYHEYGTQRKYLLPMGTPVVWGHDIADMDEVIWSPTLAELKKYIDKI